MSDKPKPEPDRPPVDPNIYVQRAIWPASRPAPRIIRDQPLEQEDRPCTPPK